MRLLLNPTPADFHAMEAAQPLNPFATVGHAEALRQGGMTVGVMQFQEDAPAAWAHAVLRRGRVGASLEVPSLPCRVSEDELRELRDIAREHQVTTVNLQSYGSPDGTVVQGTGATTTPRAEFIWELTPGVDLIESLSRTHRERARKARKAGAVVSQLPAERAMASLRRLHSESLDRREARGEDVARGEFEFGDRLMAHAGARVYGATSDGTLVAAVLVALAAEGAYTVFSGNTSEGMKLGTAHWLRLQVAECLRDEGIRVLNLAGATSDQAGLADFKRRFGALERPLVHAHLDTAVGWRHLLLKLRS